MREIFWEKCEGLLHLIYVHYKRLLTGDPSTSGEKNESEACGTNSRRLRRFEYSLADDIQGKGSVPNNDKTEYPCLPYLIPRISCIMNGVCTSWL